MSQQEEYDLPPFAYTPLAQGEIRLLLPTNDEDGLSWTLIVVNLDEKIEFDALSYVWGEQNQMFPIACNGQRHHVHRNLYTALPYLAHRQASLNSLVVADGSDREDNLSKDSTEADGQARPIWIDALCINQKDEEEKLSQIKSMNQVYRHAKIVWVWLGLPEDHDMLADVVNSLPRIANFVQWKGGALTTPGLFVSEKPNPKFWPLLLHLIANKWYSRVWVIQEFALAEKAVFLSGKHAISIQLMEDVIKVSRYLAPRLIENLANPKDITQAHGSFEMFLTRDTTQRDLLRSEHLNSSDIVYVMMELSVSMSLSSQCSLPQDRVLGILGMLDSKQYKSLGVDLYGTTEVADLYTKYSALAFISSLSHDHRHWGGWHWLNGALRQKAWISMPDLPSWVVDLHHEIQPWGFARHIDYGSSSRQHAARVEHRGEELSMLGRLVDTITDVSPAFPTQPVTTAANLKDLDNIKVLYYMQVAEWEVQARGVFTLMRHKDESWSKEDDECYWHTLILGRTNNVPEALPEYYAFRAALQKLLNIWEIMESRSSMKPTSLPDGSHKTLLGVIKYLENCHTGVGLFLGLVKYLERGRLFATASATLGFTGPGVKVGDKVCVFNGSPTPHVIRRVPGQDKDRYTFVGDAYVYGLMDGEVDEMDLQDKEIVMV